MYLRGPLHPLLYSVSNMWHYLHSLTQEVPSTLCCYNLVVQSLGLVELSTTYNLVVEH